MLYCNCFIYSIIVIFNAVSEKGKVTFRKVVGAFENAENAEDEDDKRFPVLCSITLIVICIDLPFRDQVPK
jgi:hypothetical protein